MPVRRQIKWLVAASIGLLVAWMAHRGLTGDAATPQAAPPPAAGPVFETLLVADSDIAPGGAVTRDVLRVARFPVGSVPVGGFESLDAFSAAFAAEGTPRAVQGLVAGEPVLRARLTTLHAPQRAAERLSPGARALTLRADTVISVAGLIQPGDRVDVLRADPGRDSAAVAQAVRVLAVDQRFGADADAGLETPRALTLEVSPADLAAILRAQSEGGVTLSLRAEGDLQPDPVLAQPVRQAAVRPPSVLTPAPASWSVDVVRGTERATEIRPVPAVPGNS